MFFFVILAMLVLVTILFMSPFCTLSSLSSYDFLSIVQYLVHGCVAVVDVHFACQLFFPSALGLQAPRERILETWKPPTQSFSLGLEHGLRFTSLALPFTLVFLFITTLLFTPICSALEVSVDGCFQATQNLLYSCIIVLDAHFVLQLLFPHATISGTLYECASKVRKSVVACFSRSSLESGVCFALSVCYFLFRYIVSPLFRKVVSPCAQLAWSESLYLICFICVRGYIALATLGMNLLAFLLLVSLRVFDWLLIPRLVLPTDLAATPNNKASKRRNLQARPIRSYLVGGARRMRPMRPVKKAEHFVTPPEGPSTPVTSDTGPDSLVEPPRCPIASLPTLSASSTLDAAGWEKAIIEAWFLAVVAPGNFHDIYERNLKMLRAGHVAGRFARF